MVSREDHVVPPMNSEYILQKVPEHMLWLENSYHVATLDNDKDLIVQKSGEFIKEHAYTLCR
ncbi:MAG: hypothetical protein PVS3B3_12980 [Ktedonobacteraceae bacterium]